MGRMNVCVKMVNGLGQNSSFVLLVVLLFVSFSFRPQLRENCESNLVQQSVSLYALPSKTFRLGSGLFLKFCPRSPVLICIYCSLWSWFWFPFSFPGARIPFREPKRKTLCTTSGVILRIFICKPYDRKANFPFVPWEIMPRACCSQFLFRRTKIVKATAESGQIFGASFGGPAGKLWLSDN